MGSVPMHARAEPVAHLRAELSSEIALTVDRSEYRASFEGGQFHSCSGDHNISLVALIHPPLGRCLWMMQTTTQASAITRRPAFSHLRSLPAIGAAMGSVPKHARTEAVAYLRAELFSEIWPTTTHDSQKAQTNDRSEYRASFKGGRFHSHSGDHNISLAALIRTPLGRSLWMVQTTTQASAITRRPVFSPLRC
ncbi:MAG TPA: hypothetical protein VHY84_05210 [Bryobacteraceae bacterium]|jgi:hypothetical protein|nr:hypothetical protein [Bryobacteraceae bacterium]